MVGKIHKKKISEYTEAAENEDRYSEKGDDGVEEITDQMEVIASGSESENGDIGNNDINKSSDSIIGNDDDANATDYEAEEPGLDDDETKSGGDVNDADFFAGDEDLGKKAKKRKSNSKKGGVDDYDDEPLNGATPKKKGRKAGGAAKGKAKAAKGKAKKAAVDDDEEDEGEEEYEVKDIVGHKMERGVSYFLIRWKGYTKADDTWEAESTLNCPEIIKKYKEMVSEEEDKGEEEYEVKDIVGHKTERGVSYFLIRWKGYTKADDTWEAEDTLSCPEIIEKYKESQKISSPKKKGAAAPTPAKKGKKPAAAAGKGKKDEPEEEWEVEKIVDYAEEKKGRVFRIRWKGFGPKSDTWEPENNLNCHDIIEKFLSKMKLQENVSFKELREEPKKTKRLVNETAPRTNINNPIGRKSKRATTKKRVFYGDMDD